MESPMLQRIDDKRLRKSELTALTILAHIDQGPPRYSSSYATIYAYPAVAGRIATICEITGESFQQACDRLHIAPHHRTEMLKLNTPAGERIRALAARSAPIATATSPGPLRRAEQTVVTMLAHIDQGPPRYSSSYAATFAYPVIAGRLATICEITGERFLDACDRLNITPHHRIEILNLDNPGYPFGRDSRC